MYKHNLDSYLHLKFKLKNMKTLVFATTMMIATSAMSQKTTPEAVKSAFAKEFPDITVKSWDKEDEKYEANFMKDGKQMSVTFNANGNLEETEMDITTKELPAAIASYIEKNYKGATIKEAAMITKANREKMYEAEVKGKDLMFDTKGTFIKEESEDSEDKED